MVTAVIANIQFQIRNQYTKFGVPEFSLENLILVKLCIFISKSNWSQLLIRVLSSQFMQARRGKK